MALRALLRDAHGEADATSVDDDVEATIGGMLISDGLNALRIVRAFLTKGED